MKHWFKISLIAFLASGLIYAGGPEKNKSKTDREATIQQMEIPNNMIPADSVTDITEQTVDKNNFQWPEGNNNMPFLPIYNILHTNCAHSSCHDGNFEPNLTSPQAAYYTMVMHDIKKNSRDFSFYHRVAPFDPPRSMLIERITNCCMNNENDRMPLLMEPLTDMQIDSIAAWIRNGAPDSYGEFPYTNFNPF